MNDKWTLIGQVSEGGRRRAIGPADPCHFASGDVAIIRLCLGQQTVSSCHGRVFWRRSRVCLSADLNSRNGTYVNGERLVSPIEVRNEDLIQFADMPFRFHPAYRRGRLAHDSRGYVRSGAGPRAIRQAVHRPGHRPLFSTRDRHQHHPDDRLRDLRAGVDWSGWKHRLPCSVPAAQLNQEVELSVLMRSEGIRASVEFPETPHVFVNTHPLEISGEAIVESMSALRQISPVQRITVEIHEAAVTNSAVMRDLRRRLEDLNMRLAFDDFGAGQARLVELAEVRPHYLKFDRTLVQNIDQASPQHQQMLAHLIRIVNELGVISLAEGIETAEEAAACKEMGFVLAQGFSMASPRPCRRWRLSPRPAKAGPKPTPRICTPRPF